MKARLRNTQRCLADQFDGCCPLLHVGRSMGARLSPSMYRLSGTNLDSCRATVLFPALIGPLTMTIMEVFGVRNIFLGRAK